MAKQETARGVVRRITDDSQSSVYVSIAQASKELPTQRIKKGRLFFLAHVFEARSDAVATARAFKASGKWKDAFIVAWKPSTGQKVQWVIYARK